MNIKRLLLPLIAALALPTAANADKCKRSTNSIENISTSGARRWNSPSGNYEIEMKPLKNGVLFFARPTTRKGLSVTGCYNTESGEVKLITNARIGDIKPANCRLGLKSS